MAIKTIHNIYEEVSTEYKDNGNYKVFLKTSLVYDSDKKTFSVSTSIVGKTSRYGANIETYGSWGYGYRYTIEKVGRFSQKKADALRDTYYNLPSVVIMKDKTLAEGRCLLI